jgi:4-hydroxybenzoate polyprenyltransferase
MISELIEIIRPKQWYKNMVVFAALFFSKNITNPEMVFASVVGFVALCLISSSSYIINDIIDSKSDKYHDKKKLRPIPSGRISVTVALFFAIALLILGLLGSWILGTKFFLCAIGLTTLMWAYNLGIKNIAFADVSILSSNFMIRAVSGAYAIGVMPSPWLILGTYLVALFLAIAKRKSDLDTLGEKAKEYKKVFEIYSSKVLEQFLGIVAGLLFITYCLYSFLSSQAHWIIIMMSIPVVSFIIFRYFNAAIANHKMARDADEMFGDLQMMGAIILWGILFLLGTYFSEIRTIINI